MGMGFAPAWLRQVSPPLRPASQNHFNHCNVIYMFHSPGGSWCQNLRLLFRLDALALSVIATATWLAGWLGGWVAGGVAVCHSRYCIKTTKRI